MKKVALFSNKHEARAHLRSLRDSICDIRREAVAAKVLETFYPLVKPFSRVLSFKSFPNEIDLTWLNEKLETEGRLVTPETLLLSELHLIECILVPGIGFDSSLMRIGYGKGYYDRLMPLTPAPKWGIAFQEQYTEAALPSDSHDQPVDALYLF